MVSGAFEKANLDVGMHSGCYKGPGVGIQNMTVKKYAVDVLGRNITPIEPEQRQGFDAISDDDE